jgi:hypothetical protein
MEDTSMRRTLTALLVSLSFLSTALAQVSGTFSGRVLAPDGTPAQGATITFPNDVGGDPLAQSITDADGNFALSVQEHGGRPIHRRSAGLQIEASGRGATYVDARHLTLFPDANKDLGEIVLDAGRSYYGRVVDESGRPIAGAGVRCAAIRHYMGHTAALIGTERTVTTDPDGTFRTPDLPLGRPSVNVHAAGYLNGSYGQD